MKRRVLLPLMLGCTMLIAASCNPDNDVHDPYKQWQTEVATVDAYLAANNIGAVKDLSGVRMVITQLGKGLPATMNSTVEVDYVGKLFSDGVMFDQGTTKKPISNYIDGWKIALTTLPAGSKATVYIPSIYGYGTVNQGSIPANSTLVFDIFFKEVVLSSQQIDQFKKDTTAIETYLATKGINDAVTDTTGIRYVITEPVVGPKPGLYDPLKMKFSIRLLTNDAQSVFDYTGEPSSINASRTVDYNYLQGLMVGLTKMTPGSKATLYIPSGLAYGTAGASGGAAVVPPNANIIVDVELQEIFP